ncbi:MAG: threonine/serine exporter family protein [Clostridiales bacterium]|nr:threonine/serine exporter family protein [Clostridiales bacterium]
MNGKLLGRTLDLGERMLRTGGEVSRVEDTISRILRAYGFVRVDVFTITSQIQVTAVDANGQVYNQLRRVYQWGTDLAGLEELNQMSRDICARKPNPEEIERMIADWDETDREERKKGVLIAYVGAILAASGFTVFFGGSLADAAATAVLACLITVMNRHIHTKSDNELVYYFVFSVVTGFAGSLLVRVSADMGIPMNLDKMLIGCIMLTIPGIAITYSVRDMLTGEIITGLLRFVESLLIAASIASGYILSSTIMGGVL